MEYITQAVKGQFKGKAVLSLTSGDNDKFPFTFGLSKARKILACLKDIQSFVLEEEATLLIMANKAAGSPEEPKVAVK